LSFRTFKDSKHSELINTDHIVTAYVVNDNDVDIGYTIISIETIDGRVHNFKTSNKGNVLENLKRFLSTEDLGSNFTF
jgi:hypothetical protein